MKQYAKPTDVPVRLTGENGNVFSVISSVSTGLRKAGFAAEAVEFTEKAFDCDSYDKVLQLALRTVDVH